MPGASASSSRPESSASTERAKIREAACKERFCSPVLGFQGVVLNGHCEEATMPCLGLASSGCGPFED